MPACGAMVWRNVAPVIIPSWEDAVARSPASTRSSLIGGFGVTLTKNGPVLPEPLL